MAQMTIREFLLENRRFRFPGVPNGHTTSVQSFIDDCISKALPADLVQYANAIQGWHSLLTRFMDDPTAPTLLIRLWESAPGGQTRRGAVVRMADGFEYAFASNYFARVVYAMAYLGYVPEYDDFKDMIVNRRCFISFPMHTTPEEGTISAFPQKHNAEYPIPNGFYAPGWYLAHVVGVHDDPYVGHEGQRLRDLIPSGTVEDWIPNRIWERNLVFTQDEKIWVKASWLRFLDPVNYFYVPSERYEVHVPQIVRRIGEEFSVKRFMAAKLKELVGRDVYGNFMERALVSGNLPLFKDILNPPNMPIDVWFGKHIPTAETRGDVPNSAVVTSPSSAGLREAKSPKPLSTLTLPMTSGERSRGGLVKVTHEQLETMVKRFLEDEYSYRRLERDVLGIESKEKGGGWIAKKSLDGIGLVNKYKGGLRGRVLLDVYRETEGVFREVLDKFYFNK